MFRKISHFNVLLSAGLSLCLLATGSASADVIINFDELDEAGIHVTASNGVGGSIDVTKLGSETFHLSSPDVPPGYPADATLSHIGISRTSAGLLVNILESDGSISDQVHVYQFIAAFTVIDFISDPDLFVTGVPDATVVETGVLQPVLTYTNDRGELVNINVNSDIDPVAVPEPASLTLAVIGACGLAAGAIRRRRQQEAAV